MPDGRGQLQTGVSIIVRDALPFFEPVHQEFHPVHLAKGMPLHVTLLFPFVPRHEVTDAHEQRLAELFATKQPLVFDLVSIATFPTVAYAVPCPEMGLRELMSAVWEAFPEIQPYGGAFSDPPPHATLGLVQPDGVPEDLGHRVAARVDRLFPFRCAVRDVSLMEEYEPDRWREARSFTLGRVL